MRAGQFYFSWLTLFIDRNLRASSLKADFLARFQGFSVSFGQLVSPLEHFHGLLDCYEARYAVPVVQVGLKHSQKGNDKMSLAILTFRNWHHWNVAKNVFVDPDFHLPVFHKDHLLGWSEETKVFDKSHKTFENSVYLLLFESEFTTINFLKEDRLGLWGLK